jgi:hypothetical protein
MRVVDNAFLGHAKVRRTSRRRGGAACCRGALVSHRARQLGFELEGSRARAREPEGSKVRAREFEGSGFRKLEGPRARLEGLMAREVEGSSGLEGSRPQGLEGLSSRTVGARGFELKSSRVLDGSRARGLRGFELERSSVPRASVEHQAPRPISTHAHHGCATGCAPVRRPILACGVR